MSRRSLLTSPPTMRIPSRGPGKGWRQTIRSGRPSSAPTARTSSLNSIRSGSTSSKSGPAVPKQEGAGKAAQVMVGLARRRVVGRAVGDHVGLEGALDDIPDVLEL